MNDKKFKEKLKKIKKRGERWKQEKELVDAYSKYIPERKKRKVSNIILVVVIIAVVAYTIASFILQYKTGIEVSSTLTTCFYTFFGTEILVLAGIKVSKVKHGSEISSSDCENNDEIIG